MSGTGRQATRALPSGQRRSAGQGSKECSDLGPASLAASRTHRYPGHLAGAKDPPTRGESPSLGALPRGALSRPWSCSRPGAVDKKQDAQPSVARLREVSYLVRAEPESSLFSCRTVERPLLRIVTVIDIKSNAEGEFTRSVLSVRQAPEDAHRSSHSPDQLARCARSRSVPLRLTPP